MCINARPTTAKTNKTQASISAQTASHCIYPKKPILSNTNRPHKQILKSGIGDDTIMKAYKHQSLFQNYRSFVDCEEGASRRFRSFSRRSSISSGVEGRKPSFLAIERKVGLEKVWKWGIGTIDSRYKYHSGACYKRGIFVFGVQFRSVRIFREKMGCFVTGVDRATL